MRVTAGRILKNLVLLSLVAMPVFFVVLWVASEVTTQRSRDVSEKLEAGLFFYLSYVSWVLVAGVVQQIVLLVVARMLPPRQWRTAAVLSTILLPLVLIAAGERAETLITFWPALVVSLVVYGFLIQVPSTAAPGSATGFPAR